MKIQLIRRYRGVLTDEQWIEEGAHDLPDDFAEYLVGNGHAVRVDDPLPLVTPENSVYVRTEDDEPTIVYFDPATVNFFAVEPGTDESTFIDVDGTEEETVVDFEPSELPEFDATEEREHTPVTRDEALKQFEVEREKVTKRVKRGK